MRIADLPSDSSWSHALYPADPTTGLRSRRPSVTVLDEPADIDAFFARMAG